MSRRLRSGGVLLFVGLCSVNLVTFAFHVAVSRILGPSAYGALGAVLVLTGLANTATTAVGIAVTRGVAAHDPAMRWDTRRTDRMMWTAAAIVVGVGTVSSPLLDAFLHLGSPVPVIMLAILGAASLVEVVPRGVLMGQDRFAPVASALIAGSACKLVFGAILAAVVGVSGAVTGAALGECVVAAVCIGALGRTDAGGRGAALTVSVKSLSLVGGAYGGFWLLVATDTFLARHLLTPHQSGLYVAASTAASIALYLPNNVTLAAFPSLARSAAAPAARVEEAPDVREPLAAVSLLTIATAGALALLPGLVIAVLFGSQYRAARSLLVLLAVSNGAQGLVGFLQHHQLAHHRASSLMPWAALAGLALAVYARPATPHRIATDAVAVSVALAAAMAVRSATLTDRRQRAGVGG